MLRVFIFLTGEEAFASSFCLLRLEQETQPSAYSSQNKESIAYCYINKSNLNISYHIIVSKTERKRKKSRIKTHTITESDGGAV
jgi:hypothetical protein